jgi:hypothetical protein
MAGDKAGVNRKAKVDSGTEYAIELPVIGITGIASVLNLSHRNPLRFIRWSVYLNYFTPQGELKIFYYSLSTPGSLTSPAGESESTILVLTLKVLPFHETAQTNFAHFR